MTSGEVAARKGNHRRERRDTLNRHQQRTEVTKRALIAAARRMFSRKGFEACRIEDIAAATGHSRGAFYAHFASKEDLFFAVLEVDARTRLAEIESALERCDTARQQTETLRHFYVSRAANREWALLTLEFRLFALRHPAMRAKFAATHRRIRASLRLEVVDRILRGRDPRSQDSVETTKLALEALLNGLVLEHAYDPERISLEQVKSLLARQFDAFVTAER